MVRGDIVVNECEFVSAEACRRVICALQALQVGKPETVALTPPTPTSGTDWLCAGNARLPYGERLTLAMPHVDAMPTAQALLSLAPALFQAGLAVPADQAMPLYVRDKVAHTTAEREVIKAEKWALQEAASGNPAELKAAAT